MDVARVLRAPCANKHTAQVDVVLQVGVVAPPPYSRWLLMSAPPLPTHVTSKQATATTRIMVGEVRPGASIGLDGGFAAFASSRGHPSVFSARRTTWTRTFGTLKRAETRFEAACVYAQKGVAILNWPREPVL